MGKRAPKRPSQSRFNLAPQVSMQRSTFDLSFPYKTTFDGGKLIPLPPIEVLPGDSFRVRMNALVRLATPLYPTMDNLHLSSFWFFTPNRLVWENWQKFCGEQTDPGDSTDYVIPQVEITAPPFSIGSWWDHVGLPTGATNFSFSALPGRGYNLIWNEWFRDENLQSSLTVATGDGPDSAGSVLVQNRGKRKNYITSSLPWPQKGPGIDIPLGLQAPIQGIGKTTSSTWTQADTDAIETGGATVSYPNHIAGNNPGIIFRGDSAVTTEGPSIYADLSQATGATINDWREAFQMQKLAERDARGGTRYTEILKSHFQVTSPDSRLQRPELLGTGQTPIQMNTVPQTSGTPTETGYTDTPQGNLAAYGQGIINQHGFTKSFVEHGYILGMISVRADLTFQQKIDRHWSRQTKYDMYWPALQALGEQPVLNKEVWADGGANDENIWGYQERWAEYRSSMGHITGAFRSTAPAPLDAWHYALDYDTRPALNAAFIEDEPPIERTVAVQDEPEFLMDAWVDIKAARPMPVYSVPGYIDHF